MIIQKTKRLLSALVLAVISCLLIGSFACTHNATEERDNFSVTYIDVGEGDCCYINYSNGNGMLIDTGAKGNKNYIKISKIVNDGAGLDYLLITHPDADHIGNAQKLLEDFLVKKLIVPYIADKEKFISYAKLVETAINKGVEIVYFDSTLYWYEKQCLTSFLTPYPSGVEGSSLDILNLQTLPTDEQINNISPIIYIEYMGVRFIFSGDATASQERLAVENFLGGEYICSRPKENIKEIDFLKVTHHGSNDGTSSYFLNTVNPKNAIISAGANNQFGHPSVETLDRLTERRKDINILRTDLFGNITVTVERDGRVDISCARKG